MRKKNIYCYIFICTLYPRIRNVPLLRNCSCKHVLIVFTEKYGISSSTVIVWKTKGCNFTITRDDHFISVNIVYINIRQTRFS